MDTNGGDSAGRVAKWVVALVLLLPLLLFAPSLANGFAMDGESLASSEWKENPGQPDPVISELHGPGFYFGKYYWYGESANDGLYRPMTIYSYALVFAVAGSAETTAQHLVNVFLHVLATFLVWRLMLSVGVGVRMALVVTGLFGVHAIHSEVVAGVVGRAELFAFVFGIGACLAFLRGIRAGGPVRIGWISGAVVMMFAGFCSKESGLAFGPFLLCVLLARRWSGRNEASLLHELFAGTIVFAVPLVVFLVLRHRVMTGFDHAWIVDYAANPLYGTDAITRICTAIKLWGHGLLQCCFPFVLSANYGAEVFDVEPSPWGVGVLGALIVLLVFMGIGLHLARRVPAFFLAMASFLGLSFITSNVVFATGTIYAERLYYAPSLGVCILGGLLARRFGFAKWVIAILVVWSAGCAVTILARNGVWKDTTTLFTTAARNQPRSANIQVQLAQLLRGQPERHDEAFEHLRVALELIPEYPHALREKASLHVRRREWDAAIDCFERALHSDYVELPDAKVVALGRLASLWEVKGDKKKSVDHARRGLAMAPGDLRCAKIVANLGPGVLRIDESRGLFDACVAALNERPVLAIHLGVMGEKIGADPTKVFELLSFGTKATSAAQLPPGVFGEAIFAMGSVLARKGDTAGARNIYERLLRNKTLPAGWRKRAQQALNKLR